MVVIADSVQCVTLRVLAPGHRCRVCRRGHVGCRPSRDRSWPRPSGQSTTSSLNNYSTERATDRVTSRQTASHSGDLRPCLPVNRYGRLRSGGGMGAALREDT